MEGRCLVLACPGCSGATLRNERDLLCKTLLSRSLKVEFLGKARVAWSEHRSNTNSSQSSCQNRVRYSDDELYLKKGYYILGNGEGNIVIPIGEHVYTFSTFLSNSLPSSFKGAHGEIEYLVTAKLVRSWKFDHDVTEPFYVVNHVDLNAIPYAKEPVTDVESKTYGWFTSSGHLTINVRLPHRGVVPGQSLPMTIAADNASNVSVEAFICKIREEVEFRVRDHRTKKTSNSLTQILNQGLDPSQSRTWTQTILMPQIPHANLENCSLINVNYSLVVVAKVGMMHRNFEMKIPLVLGTVPIFEAGSDFTRPPPYFEGWAENIDPLPPIGFDSKS